MKNLVLKLTTVCVLLIILLSALISCSDMETSYEGDTLVTYPEITVTGFSPTQGTSGTTVTITGTNFGEYSEASMISFNGVKVTDIISYTDTEIKVRVPENAVSGPLTVKVWTHSVVTDTDFTYVPGAQITSIAPSQASIGDHVIINGSGFGTDSSLVIVSFNGGIAEIVNITDTIIEVIVPSTGISGPITVNIGEQTAASPVFTYVVDYDLSYDFATDSNTEGWQNIWGGASTIASSGGTLNVTTSGSTPGLMNTAMPIRTTPYHYLAIKFNELPAETGISVQIYNDGNTGGVAGDYTIPFVQTIGNIYVFNIDSPNLSSSTPFNVYTYLKFNNIADQSQIKIDWIRSYQSLDDIQ